MKSILVENLETSGLESSNNTNPRTRHPKTILIGGGLAGLFTAYCTLREYKEAGEKRDVVVLAQEIHAPASAGSQILRQLDGQEWQTALSRQAMYNLMMAGYNGIADMISREGIECRFVPGYEIKTDCPSQFLRFGREKTGLGTYRPSEMINVTKKPALKLKTHPYSWRIQNEAQLNGPELLDGVVHAIERMGGHVITSVNVKAFNRIAKGRYEIHTDQGTVVADNKPFFATGPYHQRSLESFPFNSRPVETMVIVIGPLSELDARKIAPSAIAFSDDTDGHYLHWGGLDPKGYITIGNAELTATSDFERRLEEQALMKFLRINFQDVDFDSYPRQVSIGTMHSADNLMPIVGRLPDYDVAGGWAGTGYVAGYAAAKAYSEWIVRGCDKKLEKFELMQREFHYCR